MENKFKPGVDFEITPEGEEAALETLFESARQAPELLFVEKLLEQYPGARVVLIGGIVRDTILGLPSKDYDLLIDGINQGELAQFLQQFGQVKDIDSRAYGVTKFTPTGFKENIDISVPRRDKYEPGKRPKHATVDIENITIEEELARRDFTMNTLALNLADGSLIDPFDGLADIRAGLVRAVGEPKERFMEDPARILRGIRFAAKYGFDIDGSTFESMKTTKAEVTATYRDDTKGKNLERVSLEKIGEEFAKAANFDPELTLKLYDEVGLLPDLFPELEDLKGLDQPAKLHTEGDVFIHTKLLLHHLMKLESEIDLAPLLFDISTKELHLAAIFHDIGKAKTKVEDDESIHFHGHDQASAEMVSAICRRLRYDNDLSAAIVWLVANHMNILNNFTKMKFDKQKKMARHPLFPALIILGWADASASIRPDGSTDTDFVAPALETLHQIQVEDLSGRPREIINGREIIEIIKSRKADFNPQKEGRLIGTLKNLINDLYDRDEIKTKAEALAFIDQWLDSPK